MAQYTVTRPTVSDLYTGVASVFYSDVWNHSGELTLTYLGDTEGGVTMAANGVISELIPAELTAAAVRAMTVGQRPVITMPFYFGDPAFRDIVSSTGSRSVGHSGPLLVTQYTVVIFPRELLVNPSTNELRTLDSNGGAWQLDGVPLTADQTDLLGKSVWCWQGYFTDVGQTWGFDRAGVDIQSVEFVCMHNWDYPEGEQVLTRGDPFLVGIDIETGTLS